MKPEAFGVIWRDLMLGHLSLSRPNAASALELAARIRERGVGKVEDVRAVHVPAGTDDIVTLEAAA